MTKWNMVRRAAILWASIVVSAGAAAQTDPSVAIGASSGQSDQSFANVVIGVTPNGGGQAQQGVGIGAGSGQSGQSFANVVIGGTPNGGGQLQQGFDPGIQQPLGSGSTSGGSGLPAVSAVPEPESYALMLAGLGLVGAIARRRKAKQTA